MKFSRLVLIACLVYVSVGDTHAKPVARVIAPLSQAGARVWAGSPLGFLTIVDDIPEPNQPNDSGPVETPQVLQTEDQKIWWGFHVLPPLANLANATLATSLDGRIWVGFDENSIPPPVSENSVAPPVSENSVAPPVSASPPVADSTAVPVADSTAVPVADSTAAAIDPRIWAGYPNNNGQVVLPAVQHPSAEPTPNTPTNADNAENADNANKAGRIWWGYPDGNGKGSMFSAGNPNAPADPNNADKAGRIWWGYPDGNGKGSMFSAGSLPEAEQAGASRSGIWWGYPEGVLPMAANQSAPVSPSGRIWWGYPDGNGKGSIYSLSGPPAPEVATVNEASLPQASLDNSVAAELPPSPAPVASDAASPPSNAPVPEVAVPNGSAAPVPQNETASAQNPLEQAQVNQGDANVFWSLPLQNATSIPDQVAVGHDATGRVWWGYPVDPSKSVSLTGDAGIAYDRDGSQFRVWWGYPDNSTAVPAVPVQVEARDQKLVAVLPATAPATAESASTKAGSLLGAIRGFLGGEDTVKVPKNGEQSLVNQGHISEVKQGELRRRRRAETLIDLFNAQSDEVLREDLGALAEQVIDDLKEYQLNAAAAQNSLGQQPASATAPPTQSIGVAADKEVVAQEIQLGERFDALKAKYDKLLNEVGNSVSAFHESHLAQNQRRRAVLDLADN